MIQNLLHQICHQFFFLTSNFRSLKDRYNILCYASGFRLILFRFWSFQYHPVNLPSFYICFAKLLTKTSGNSNNFLFTLFHFPRSFPQSLSAQNDNTPPIPAPANVPHKLLLHCPERLMARIRSWFRLNLWHRATLLLHLH